jgi:hypothetical protein
VKILDEQKLTRIDFWGPLESLKRGANILAIAANRKGPFPASKAVKVENVELHLE